MARPVQNTEPNTYEVTDDDLATVEAEQLRVEALKEIPRPWKRWWHLDKTHSSDWRSEAREDYAFEAGKQWSEQDKQFLEEQLRPVITFNRVSVIVDTVAGHEIQNRNEVRFMPREEGDAQANEIFTEAARWFDDEAEAEDEDSEAFRDCAICGMGWTETRLSFDDDPEGIPEVERIDPLQMVWDHAARKQNLKDARRVWRMLELDWDVVEDRWPGFSRYELDASMWANADHPDDPHRNDPEHYYESWSEDDEFPVERKCRILQLQYWVWEFFVRVADPFQPGNIVSMSMEEYQRLQTIMAQQFPGVPIKGVVQRRKQYRQAFLGNVVLQDEIAPCKSAFSFNCITGKFDRNDGTWYGLVRAMKDPQRWANKWLSQMLHIMNSNSQGGIIIEEGAIPEGMEEEFADSWARPDGVSIVANGTISGSRLRDKPQPTFPQGFQILTQFAVDAIREVVGVSLEMMGMREQDQPGILEYQRKQAGMAVLAGIFNSLRRYRKRRGRLMLHYITSYLSDGRLVRIVGEGRQQYVPLMRRGDVTYDVIVDESASSVNQKEMVWTGLMQILPGIKDVLPPQAFVELLSYSPFPTSVVEKVKQIINAPNPQAEEQAKNEAAKLLAEVTKTQAEGQRAQVEGQKAQAEIGKVQSEIVENQADTLLKQARAANELRSGERPGLDTPA